MEVTLLDNSIQSKLLAVSTSYISFDWNDKDSATVYVTMNFESTQFTETSKDCADNGCVTFTGNTTNGGDNYDVTCDANWLDIARNDEYHSFSVTCINDNEGEKDRIGKIEVSYCGLTKTIDVVQFANTSYITYTITSNAEDGAEVKFGNEHTTTLKDGIAEYTRRQVGAQTLQVTISGGLPSSSINYTFKNTGDTTAFTVSNLGVPDFKPSLEAYKITSQYTYDESLNSVLTSTTVYCSPGERKNVEIFVMNNKDKVSWSVEEPDYSWIHPIRYINDYVVIDRNENNVERSAILTYHIDESPSTTFRCKVMQTKGQYTFQFHSGKPWNQTIIAASNFTIDIDSYLNSEDNLIAFEASYNSDEVSVVTNSKSATINLKRNYLLEPRHVRINFIQNKSNKRITLYVFQKEAECKIGDVYSYNATTKQYACFRFSIGENIEDGFTPIGVVVMPFDNDCPSNPNCARIISLTESQYDSNSGIPYDWPMRLEKDKKKIKETKDPYYENVNATIGYKHFSSLSDENYIGNSYDKNYMSLYPMNEYRALGSVYRDSYKIAFDNGQKLYYAKEIRRERGHVEYDFKRKMKPFTKDNSNTKISDYNGIFQLQNDDIQEIKNYAYTDFKGKENFIKENKQLFGKGTYNESLYNYISNYSTSGTKTGDWYLGSVGEMSYVSVYSNIINQTLKLLSSKYTITLIDTNDNLGGFVGWNKNEHDNYDTSDDGYWTSTMSNQLGEWHDFYVSAIVVIGTGMIGWQEHQRRDNAHHLTLKRVRPMLMINKLGGYPL